MSRGRTRTVGLATHTVQPRVEYTLTEAGHGLRSTVDRMCDWTYRYFQQHIESARQRFEARRSVNA
ncbi:winged helix-turn-helix transcriptional regulator [Nocardia vinacea]|uniref:winged helix-turn-helix transcriptional regulator n=1 Tax=Nocardia vinacea TaxID=96468 RepID=UPI00340429B1